MINRNNIMFSFCTDSALKKKILKKGTSWVGNGVDDVKW